MRSIDPTTVMLLLPLAGAAAAFILGTAGRDRLAGYGVALAFLLGALPLGISFSRLRKGGPVETVVGGWAPSIGIQLTLDAVGWTLLVTLFFLSLLILLYAIGEGSYGSHFYAVYAVAVAGMAGVILSADLFNLFVFFEVMSLSATILIAYKRGLTGIYSAFRYLLITVVSVALYLLGLFILYRESGELAFAVLLRQGESSGGAAISSSALAGLLLFSGVAIRVALVPFHTWLPDAHAQAPNPVSALLSGLMIKAAFVALWRVVGIFSRDPRFPELLLLFGVASALLGVVLALVQSDAKRLLAYHSISQMGYIVAGAGAGGINGALYHAVGHAHFKSLLFLVVGCYISVTGSRDIYRMSRSDLASGGRRFGAGGRIVAPSLFLLAAAAIAGVPPFAGFVSKALIGKAMGDPVLYWALKAASLGTAASFVKLGGRMLPAGAAKLRREVGAVGGSPGASRSRGPGGPHALGDSRAPGGPGGPHGPGAPQVSERLQFAAMGIMAVPLILLGVFPAPVLALLGDLGLSITPGTGEAGVYSVASIVESFVILLVGVVVYLLLRTGGGRRFSAALRDIRLGVDGSLAVITLGVLATVALFLI